MANAVSKSQSSLIAMLAREKAAVFQAANRDSDGFLSEAQLEQVNALNLTIANAAAASRKDAAIQVRIACELVELYGEGVQSASALDAAHSALRSAVAALSPRRRAA